MLANLTCRTIQALVVLAAQSLSAAQTMAVYCRPELDCNHAAEGREWREFVVTETALYERCIANVDGAARSELLDLSRWYGMISEHQWRRELNAGIDEAELARLRVNTHTGRPLGSDSFLSKLERLLGRRVRPLPVGRPKKKSTKMSK
jgi:hypothetical protein